MQNLDFVVFNSCLVYGNKTKNQNNCRIEFLKIVKRNLHKIRKKKRWAF